MADEAIQITITGRIDGKIAGSLREISAAALQADTSLSQLKAMFANFGSVQLFKTAIADVREFRNEINRANQTQRTFAAGTDGVTTSVLKAARATSQYTAELRKVEAANVKIGGSFTNLSGIVGTFAGLFGGIFAVQGYAEAQDALTGMQNKIRSLTADMERQAFIQQQLFEIANLTRTGVEATTDGFVRFSKAMQGASDPEVLRFVETLNKSLISAGRSTAEVNSIVIQLGQALTSGRLMGDEFRSLSENLPREALQAFADQLGVGVDQLKELSSQGLITTEVIRNAFGELADSMDAAFARTVPTINQAITVLKNNFIEFTASTSGGAGLIAQAIILIGKNLGTIIPIVAAFAATWLTIKAVGVLMEIGTAITSLIFVIARGAAAVLLFVSPWALLAAAVLTAMVAFAFFTGSLDGLIETVKGYTGQLFAIISETSGLNEVMGASVNTAAELKEGFAELTSATTEQTDATQENESAIKKWGDTATTTIDKVRYSYEMLTAAQKANLAIGAQRQFDSLQRTGPVGSSTSIGRPTNNTTITTLPRYATGGSFMVGGKRGVDKNLVQFRASANERVDVLTPAQQKAQANNGGNNGGPPVYNFYITTPDADSFRLSRQQMGNDVHAALA